MLTVKMQENINFLFFIIFAIFIPLLILSVSFFLGTKSNEKNKNTAFESGIVEFGNTHIRFSNKFYLIAIIFVIFDVEILYLYIWAICIKCTGWIGFFEIFIFIFTLLIELIYIIKMKILNFTKKN